LKASQRIEKLGLKINVGCAIALYIKVPIIFLICVLIFLSIMNCLFSITGLHDKYNNVLTCLPKWLRKQVDTIELAGRLRPYIVAMKSSKSWKETVPFDPLKLCQTTCSNLPLTDAQKSELIILGSCHQQLHFLLEIFEKVNTYLYLLWNLVGSNCLLQLLAQGDCSFFLF